MTTLNVNTITPAGNTLTLGASGDSVVIGDNDIRVNTVKDAGGNTLWVSNGSGVLSSVKVGIGGADKLLSTQTASSSASLSFTSGIDSTYKEYVFKFININPATDGAIFQFNGSTDGGSNYNTIKTTTNFFAYHAENDGSSGLTYSTSRDLAQSTAYQPLFGSIGSGADESASGELHLFNPSSTTYVKNFYFTGSEYQQANEMYNEFVGGYLNLTTAVNAISFQMSSGNINAGTIKMYGIAS